MKYKTKLILEEIREIEDRLIQDCKDFAGGKLNLGHHDTSLQTRISRFAKINFTRDSK